MRFLFPFLCLLASCRTPLPAPTPCEQLLPACGKQQRAGLEAKYTVQTALLQTPTLINGKPAEPSDWPASVYARVPGGACSATIVGDRVLFIASHCVADGGSVSFTAHANNYTARCSQHPDYKKNTTADWAACLIDRPVIGITFEVLGTGEKLRIGQQVLLSGYGCVVKGGGGGNDGIFRTGFAQIQGLPSAQTFDVVTVGGSAVCFGDSGGAAYALHSDGSRVIFGVNSRGDIDTTSYLPAVSSKSFIDWMRVWARTSNNVKVCGIHSDANHCRSGGKPDGNFEVSSIAGCIKGFIQPNFIDQKDEIVYEMQKSLNKFTVPSAP